MAELPKSDWRMDSGGPERRSSNAAVGPSMLTDVNVDDRLTPDARVESLVTQDGMAYYTRADGCLVAVATDAGAIEWTRQVAPDPARYPHGPWLCVADEYLIVGGTGVSAYDRKTGAHERTYIDPSTEGEVGTPSLWQPVELSSGTLVATRGPEAICVDKEGHIQWKYELDPDPPDSFDGRKLGPEGTETFYHPSADKDMVYLLVRNLVAYVPEASVEGAIHAVTHGGQHQWTATRMGHVGRQAPAVTAGDSGVYISQHASSGTPTGQGVSRYDKATGELDWEHEQSTGELAYDGERLLIADDWDKTLTALNPVSGAVLWECDVAGLTGHDNSTVLDSALVVGAKYAYAALDDLLVAIDKATGAVQDTRRFEYLCPTRFVLHDRSLYYGSEDGALHEIGEKPQPDTPVFCPNCGQDLTAVSPAQFCPNCGTKL